MDWYASSPSDDGLSTVTAKDADVSLSEKDLLQLHSINPLEDSDEFGIEGRSVCPGNWYSEYLVFAILTKNFLHKIIM